MQGSLAVGPGLAQLPGLVPLGHGSHDGARVAFAGPARWRKELGIRDSHALIGAWVLRGPPSLSAEDGRGMA
jgi:hypothetical protein